MAAACTITEETFGSVKKIVFAWTSAADGTVMATTTYAYSGEVIGLVTVPGSGASQPTDLYDVVVNDADGLDILAGQGANRSNANTERVLKADLGCVANDKLTLSVTNAGDTKTGTVYVYIR